MNLRDQEGFYRALVDQSLDVITVLDANGVIVFQSRSVERTLGYEPHELVGRSVFDFIHREDLARAREAFDQTPSGEPSPLVEFRCRHKDGSWRAFEGVGRVSSDLSHKPLGIVHARDISERKRLEDQYRHSQKLETIGRMTAAIVHDFNNLLTTIHGHANLALDCSVDELERGSLMQILAASERAAGFTKQLLGYVRSADRLHLNEAPADAHAAIIELARILEPLLGRTKLALALGAQRCSVGIERGLVVQIVMNLAVNARDAMPEGGVLTITTRNVSHHDGVTQPGDDYIAIEVADTGIGIPADMRARVFEPFFTTKAPGQGSGLGLSTVFDIVQQARGHIEIDSTVGQGTTFRVLLPLSQ